MHPGANAIERTYEEIARLVKHDESEAREVLADRLRMGHIEWVHFIDIRQRYFGIVTASQSAQHPFAKILHLEQPFQGDTRFGPVLTGHQDEKYDETQATPVTIDAA